MRAGSVLLVHSSLGPVSGGPDTVLDALGPQGTLCLPTLSYLFVSSAQPVFDVKTTPTNLGTAQA